MRKVYAMYRSMYKKLMILYIHLFHNHALELRSLLDWNKKRTLFYMKPIEGSPDMSNQMKSIC